MGVDDNQEKIVEMLAGHEEAIGELYSEYAKKLPDSAEFWEKLAAEEEQHAYWLRRLNKRIQQENCGYIDTKKFSEELIKESLRRIKKKIEEVKESDIKLTDALMFALSAEASILENKYFEIFVGEIAEIKQVQYCLEEVTKEHRERISRALSDNQTT
jgi:rubrerythrin